MALRGEERETVPGGSWRWGEYAYAVRFVLRSGAGLATALQLAGDESMLGTQKARGFLLMSLNNRRAPPRRTFTACLQ